MAAPGVDPEAILETLGRHRVAFVVVGGYALELWDVAVPPTMDVDITPERSRVNLRRLAIALDELGARIRVTGSDPVAVPGGLTAEMLAEVTVLNLVTRHGPLDITVVPAGTGGYPDLAARAITVEVGDTRVELAHLEDVARSKEAAGRPKDIMVLPAIWDHLSRRR